ncbi:MAG TPA: hypothetical protein PLZ08_04155 [Bacillota bacterium]|nr:hypothetical protein [Bacillota bacterium]HOL09410.1 hypothetical protein [Bacillota bacterium]HPO97134.1 hypothetical protein [Bacillota bacterium]
MNWLLGLIYFGLAVIIGACMVYFTKESIKINLLLSFIIVSSLSPFWSMGIISGQWFGIAFFGSEPDRDPKKERLIVISLRKIFLFSLLTFSGFMMTLIFYFRLKTAADFDPHVQQVFAWIFLVMIEVCFFRVIARWCPKWYRKRAGYGIAFFNFLMIFYCVYSYGLLTVVMTFIGLMIISPLLLKWIDYRSSNLYSNYYHGVKK